MNFIFVSPNFPVRYYKWTESLKARGVNVLAIGDAPYPALHSRLIASVTEYYFVPDMNDFSSMCRAVEYFERKYGHIDALESMNEWWLRSDAKLRARFGIEGLLPRDMDAITAKSDMKKYFEQGGAKTIRYLLVTGPEDKEKAEEFVKQVGYPVFVKPNIGVGASDSYRLNDREAFDRFFSRALPEPYIMEEYVSGSIVSFDGICDGNSEVVFATTDHFPTPIAEIVNEGLDYYYYDCPFSLPMVDIDAKEFEKVGRQVVKAFGIKKRFFHIEFFVLKEDQPGLGKKGDFVALECNMRAPGGDTPDLIDYGNSVSVYDIYADVMVYGENRTKPYPKPYYAFATHRRDTLAYEHPESEIYEKYRDALVQTGRYPAHMAVAMGDRYYDAKFETLEEGLAFDAFVREKVHYEK